VLLGRGISNLLGFTALVVFVRILISFLVFRRRVLGLSRSSTGDTLDFVSNYLIILFCPS
jgi:amino acid permease